MALTQRITDLEQLQTQRIGYMAVSLTNYDSDLEPAVAEGSVLEIAGALFEAAANEPIAGWGPIGNSTDVYIKINAATLCAEFTTTPPTWSTSKQGWYDALHRYLAKLHKDAGGLYTLKRIVHQRGYVELTDLLANSIITTPKVATGAITKEKMSFVFTGEEVAPVLGAGSSALVPAGRHWIGILTGDVTTTAPVVEMFRTAAWYATNLSFTAKNVYIQVISDGTNVRIRNADSVAHGFGGHLIG